MGELEKSWKAAPSSGLLGKGLSQPSGWSHPLSSHPHPHTHPSPFTHKPICTPHSLPTPLPNPYPYPPTHTHTHTSLPPATHLTPLPIPPHVPFSTPTPPQPHKPTLLQPGDTAQLSLRLPVWSSPSPTSHPRTSESTSWEPLFSPSS